MATTQGIRAGKAFVELFADDSKLVRGLRRAEKKLKAFGSKIRSIGLLIAGAGAAMFAPLAASAKLFASYGDETAKMAKRTGLSVEALSELQYAAQLSDVDVQNLEKGIRGMQRTVYDAGNGLSTATDALADLNMTVADLANLSPEQQFKLLADQVSKISDPTLKAAVAMKIFGISGTKLLPMFTEGAKGIEAMQAEARRLGLTMSGVDAKAAEDFSDALGRLWAVVKMGIFNLGSALVPTLQELVKKIMKVMVLVSKWIKENHQIIVVALKLAGVVTAVGASLVVLGAILSGMGSILGVIITVIGAAASVMGVLGTVIGALISPIGLVLAAMTALGVHFLKTSGVAAKALAWLEDQFGTLKAAAMEAYQGIADALAGGSVGLAVKVLWQALEVQWLKGVNALLGVWLGFKTNFMQYAAQAFYGAVKIAAGAWAGLRAAWVQTVAFLKNTWLSFTATFASAQNKAVGIVTRQLLKLQGLFDSSFDVEGAIRIAQTNEQADQRQIDSTKQQGLSQSNQQRDKDLANIGSEFEGTLKALDVAAAQAGKKQKDAAQAQVDAASAKLVEARKAYQDSLDEAKRLKNAAPSGQPDGTTTQLPSLDGLADALQQAVDRSIKVRGTFNAAAVQGLTTTSDTAERTASATEQTARSAKRIERQVNTGTLSFG